MKPPPAMTSNRPYLIRAIYDWVNDNGYTPHLLVDARQPHVRVPAHAVKDGQIVLNVAMRAVANLDLGNDRIRFLARFSGASQQVDVPVTAVLAIYAQENGQGMMFPIEAPATEADEIDAVTPETETAASADEPPAPPPRKGPSLRVVK